MISMARDLCGTAGIVVRQIDKAIVFCIMGGEASIPVWAAHHATKQELPSCATHFVERKEHKLWLSITMGAKSAFLA
jgi:hypothetical protein